ncbi:hypothetical protein ACFWWB_37495 [Streptomyces sp. NPDC058690]|uniref:hypothetical protein n=1 Tax=unclassified Streptomyces TaxID=2593676 RepID=UPI00364DCBDB
MIVEHFFTRPRRRLRIAQHRRRGDDRAEVNRGIAESALPKAFTHSRADVKATRSCGKGRQEYRILVAAEKHRAGFYPPLLITMYGRPVPLNRVATAPRGE